MLQTTWWTWMGDTGLRKKIPSGSWSPGAKRAGRGESQRRGLARSKDRGPFCRRSSLGPLTRALRPLERAAPPKPRPPGFRLRPYEQMERRTPRDAALSESDTRLVTGQSDRVAWPLPTDPAHCFADAAGPQNVTADPTLLGSALPLGHLSQIGPAPVSPLILRKRVPRALWLQPFLCSYPCTWAHCPPPPPLTTPSSTAGSTEASQRHHVILFAEKSLKYMDWSFQSSDSLTYIIPVSGCI